MIGSTLFLVPQEDVHLLAEHATFDDLPYKVHEVERLDFGYWELFAHALAAGSVFGDVLCQDHPSGSFAFRWSQPFLDALLRADEQVLRAAARLLATEPSSARMTEAEVLQECLALKQFVAAATPNDHVVVEIAQQL